MKTYPKIDLLGEDIQSRAYGQQSVANLRIGDQYETGEFVVKHCSACGVDWSRSGMMYKFHKYEKGWGFGLRLKKELCPECKEKRTEV